MGGCYDKQVNRYFLHVPETLPLQTVRSSGVRHQLKGLDGGTPKGEKGSWVGVGDSSLEFR